jgi:hypothetical protein
MDISLFDDPTGLVALETMRNVRVGMTQDEVVAAIGQPKLRVSPDSVQGPTAVFQSIGFTVFRFDADDDIDAVWVYVHDRRGKLTLNKLISTHLGFRDGVMTGAWQEHKPFPASSGG